MQDGSFGQSIGLSSNGSVLLIGSSVGGAWVFTRAGSSWKQGARLAAPVQAGSLFGYSVGLSSAGTTAVVGAPYDGSGATKPAHVRVRVRRECAVLRRGAERLERGRRRLCQHVLTTAPERLSG